MSFDIKELISFLIMRAKQTKIKTVCISLEELKNKFNLDYSKELLGLIPTLSTAKIETKYGIMPIFSDCGVTGYGLSVKFAHAFFQKIAFIKTNRNSYQNEQMKKVKCCETGDVFESKLYAALLIVAVGKAKNIRAAIAHIRQACLNSKKAYGYTWQYI